MSDELHSWIAKAIGRDQWACLHLVDGRGRYVVTWSPREEDATRFTGKDTVKTRRALMVLTPVAFVLERVSEKV